MLDNRRWKMVPHEWIFSRYSLAELRLQDVLPGGRIRWAWIRARFCAGRKWRVCG